MDGIVVCEVCGDYVYEEDLTQCKHCFKECCEKCIDFVHMKCEDCLE